MNRRAFLAAAAAAPAAFAQSNPPKRIAAILTEYRPGSHADVTVGKYLEGWLQDGKSPGPRSKIVSMYTEQVPDNDMSRPMAAKYGVPLYRTIHEALTLGGDDLAVDGVLLIGEHGDYPMNDKDQKLYPRFKMFLEITDTYRRTGHTAPIFNDKHLSYSFIKAKRMVEISEQMGFPMMAGSSVPVAHRRPAIDFPWGEKATKAVAISYSGLDIYGFHLLESLQCMVERRQGGETGVRAVQCLEHDAVWNFLDTTPWAKRLFDKALTHSETLKTGDMRTNVKSPSVFRIEYNDGLEAAAFLLTGAVEDFTVAIDVPGRPEPVSTLMYLQNGRPHPHFGCLVMNIEKMFETGVATYPVQRTLLTSGMLDYALESRFQGHKRLATPQLDVDYWVGRDSHFCVGPLDEPPRSE
ncbi:MAG: hypothetical protein H6509_09260 [Bryobacterales bacterium]|nr:hypothetical protein [Acidobacteriota bacterium]MCB9384792.1 hypothetical protein [Bryobacterales bacterium]